MKAVAHFRILAFAILALTLTNIPYASAQYQHWLKVQREGAGRTLSDVFFTDLNHGVAVGNLGCVAVTTDGGEHWFETQRPLSGNLYAVGFTDALHGTIAADDGIYFTSDGGFNWSFTISGIPSWVGIVSKEYINPHSGAGFVGGGPIIATGGGGSWSPMTIDGLRALEGIGFADGSHGIMVDDQGKVFRSSNGGATWSAGVQVIPNPFSAIEYPSLDTAFASSGGTVYRSIDSGKTWKDAGLVGAGHISSISFYNSRLGMGVSTDGQVFSTTNGGDSWSLATTIGYPTRVRLYDATHAVIVGGGGTLTETNDFGASWHVHPGKFSNDLFGVAFPTNNRLVVVGKGIVAYSDDGGVTFARPSVPQANYSLVQFLNPNLGVAIGDTAAVITHDQGTTWTRMPLVKPSSLQTISFIDSLRFYILDATNKIYKTADGGITWTVLQTPEIYPSLLHFSDDQHGVVMGQQNYYTNDGGATWTQEQDNSLFAMVTQFWFTPLHGIVAGQSGIQGRTYDGGLTWKIDTVKNGGYTKSIFMTDSLNGTLVTGGDVPWHTTDGGSTWAGQFRDSIVPPGTLGLNGIAFATPDIGYAVGYGGLILKTVDGTNLAVRETSMKLVSQAYPNPARDLFTVSLPNAKPSDAWLFDETGANVRQAHTSASDECRISVAGLSSGLYFYRILQDGSVVTGRVSVER